MAGKLTTHVLDTGRGVSGAGMRVRLSRLSPEARLITETKLDETGRATLLGGPVLETGVYEIVFSVGLYQRDLGASFPDPAFLDEVPVRFGISDPASHYHVPLVVSPYGYSTYRGG